MIEVHTTTTEESGLSSSLRLIDWFDVGRVRDAKILVVGAGAIGNEVLKNLAMLGVGNIFIMDMDIVEISNLSRSILFSVADANQPKALVAARSIERINPSVTAHWKVGNLMYDLGLGVIRRMDVVIAGLDNVRARFRLNDMCLKASRPWIEAGIGVLNGDVSVYRPDSGACFECYMPPELINLSLPCNRLASRYDAEGKVATTPTMASIVGGVQAQEALKLLHLDTWEGRTLSSRKFVFNGTSGESMVVNLKRRPSCPKHSGLQPERLVEALEFSATKTTVGELFDCASDLLRSEISLELNFVLALRLNCNCRRGKRIMKPLEKLYMEDLRCKKCNFQPMHAEAVTPADKITKQLLESHPELRKLKLSEIGIPPLEIIRARGSIRRRTRKGKSVKADSWIHVPKDIHIELTGDLRPGLHFRRA
jgi:adenylyltransferase/sulfurtransferase